MRRFLILVFAFMFSVICMAQTKDASEYMSNPQEALADANSSFVAGDYQKTIRLVGIYSALSGSNNGNNLLDRAQICQENIEKAASFITNNNYIEAFKCYETILQYNPDDKAIKSLYANTKQLSCTIKVGEKNNEGFTVCFVDNSGHHGWIMKEQHTARNNNRTCSDGWRIPSLDELKQIYNNRFVLGLNKTYWTSTVKNEFYEYYYVLDFGTGKVRSRDNNYLCWRFEIKNF